MIAKRQRGLGGGQEIRSWPLLVPLILVVIAAAACVFWLLGEAMRNEQSAVRASLAQVYQSHLALLHARMIEQWNANLKRLNAREPPAIVSYTTSLTFSERPAIRFAKNISEGLAESVICFDGSGGKYPDEEAPSNSVAAPGVDALLVQAQGLARAYDTKRLANFVLASFPASDARTDGDGRLVAANVGLLALETIGDSHDSGFRQIENTLVSLMADYSTVSIPSGQRRFIMHEIERMDPSQPFPLLGAEDLAAKFLDARAAILHGTALRQTDIADVWSAESPDGNTLALYTTDGVRKKVLAMMQDASLPAGVYLLAEAPGEAMSGKSVLAEIPVGAELPGWRLAVAADGRALFDSAAAHRVNFLVLVACTVIAGICALAVFIARSFGRQARLARLKNDLVANVSHELKTPLTAMRALVETLLNTEHPDSKTTREYLELIAAENMRLSRLIENFLTFSRLERNRYAFEFEPVHPEAIVDAAVAAFGERAHSPGCTLAVKKTDDLPAIEGDADALTTALLNLLDNAWKYTGAEKQIRVSTSQRNGSVAFAVSDNGVGMAKSESRRVFERFYQSDQRLAREVGGCGLGLSIVQSIVAMHHGRVHVESEPGRGSTFAFEIPAIGRAGE